jgi:hypothetical protein
MVNPSHHRWRHHTSSKHRSQALWAEFLELFVETLKATPPCVLVWAWKSAKNRTSLYRNGILPKVAHALDLIDAYELFRVDSTFCVGQSGTHKATLVPIIHVESENKAASAGHEIRKLCALTSRLKVLISCDEWSASWPHGGHAERYLSEWRGLVHNHNLYHPDDCEMGAIVAERRDEGTHAEAIYFYATVLTAPVPAGPLHGELIFSMPIWGIEPCDPQYTPEPPPGSDFDPKPGSSDNAHAQPPPGRL